MTPPPDTFFTTQPEWGWLVVLYFFVAGIAAGSYFLAGCIGLFGVAADRPLARLGHYVALPAVIICAPLLTFDLTRPERFWHMIVQSETGWPMFKLWSPMSVGAWALLVFGGFALVSFIGALVESGRLSLMPPRILTTMAFRKLFTMVGALIGFFIASYTGVLLSVTNRPIWADSNLIGLLFLVSAASTSGSLLILLGRAQGVARESLRWLLDLDRWVMILELVLLVVFMASLGSLALVWVSVWGVLLVVGVLLLGILIPLALHYRPQLLGGLSIPAAAVLVLLGGLILRAVVVFASEAL